MPGHTTCIHASMHTSVHTYISTLSTLSTPYLGTLRKLTTCMFYLDCIVFDPILHSTTTLSLRRRSSRRKIPSRIRYTSTHVGSTLPLRSSGLPCSRCRVLRGTMLSCVVPTVLRWLTFTRVRSHHCSARSCRITSSTSLSRDRTNSCVHAHTQSTDNDSEGRA